jgi:serine/threonine protein kinase
LFEEKYRIIERLGEGGMSVVYKAHDLMVDRMVAIKLLHRNRADDRTSTLRFQQEAKAAGQLNHPNIVRINSFDEVGDTLYLVMDYVEGTSLAQRIREKPLSESEAFDLFLQTARALDHAHTAGIVHRDLKPSNVMLACTPEGKTMVRVVDFGIAKIEPAGDATGGLTQTGEVFGSPLYMSPEQIVGQKCDARSDIYSMGCLMYECLTGRTPFSAETAMEVALKHINERPTPLGKNVSGTMAGIVLRCLEKQPDHRFQSMAELISNLESAQQGKSIRWLPPQLVRRLKVCAAVLLLLAAATAGWFAYQHRSLSDAERRQLLADVQLKWLRCQQSYQLHDYASALTLCQQVVDDLDKVGKGDTKEQSMYLAPLADLYFINGQKDKSAEVYRRIYGIYAHDPPEDEYQMNVAKSIADLRDRWNPTALQIEPFYRRALEICERNYGPQSVQVSNCLTEMIKFYHWKGEHQVAGQLEARKANIDALNRSSALSDLMYKSPFDYIMASDGAREARDWEKAARPLHAAETTFVIPPVSINRYLIDLRYGILALDVEKNLAKAEKYFASALAVERAVAGQPLKEAEIVGWQGALENRRGNADKALSLFKREAELARQGDPISNVTGCAYMHCGQQAKETSQAAAYYKQAMEVFEKLGDPTSTAVARSEMDHLK